MALLKFADLAPKRKHADLHVDELQGEIRVLQLSAGDSLRLREMSKGDGKFTREMNVYVLRKAVVDEENKPLFKDDQAVADFLNKISTVTLKLINDTVGSFGDEKPKEPNAEEGKSEGSPASSSDSA